MAITLILFVYGFFNIGHPIQTHYLVQTDKQIGNYRIALITDTHFGTIQNPKILEEKIAEINKQNLDFVVLGGDIVEEKTSKEDMEKAFQILGSIKSRYGIYYIYGNHDRQSYSQKKSYTREELKNTIKKNGITILKDSYKEINGELILADHQPLESRKTANKESICNYPDIPTLDKYGRLEYVSPNIFHEKYSNIFSFNRQKPLIY